MKKPTKKDTHKDGEMAKKAEATIYAKKGGMHASNARVKKQCKY